MPGTPAAKRDPPGVGENTDPRDGSVDEVAVLPAAAGGHARTSMPATEVEFDVALVPDVELEPAVELVLPPLARLESSHCWKGSVLEDVASLESVEAGGGPPRW